MNQKLEIRFSQALYNFSTGSIVDFPGLSLMILSPDITNIAWGNEDHKIHKKKLFDERLADIFDVENFVQPPELNDSQGIGIQAIRFPNSLFCPNCKSIHFSNLLSQRKDLYVDRNAKHFDILNRCYFCPTCNNKNLRINLSPTRFVIANEYGFIDDFPWDWYCHRDNKFQNNRKNSGDHSCYNKTNGNHLELYQEGSSASLSDIQIKCKVCKAKESLGSIFDQEETFMRKYDNYLTYRKLKLSKPWVGRFVTESVLNRCPDSIDENSIRSVDENKIEDLKKVFPRVLQRGGGNVQFSITHNGISLPHKSYGKGGDSHFKKLDDLLKNLFKVLPTLQGLDSNLERYKKILDGNIEDFFTDDIRDNYKDDEIKSFIKSKVDSEETVINSEETRWQEYNCFLNFDDKNADPNEWYKSSIFGSQSLQKLPFLENVVVLHKIRLLNILKGFTRIRPLSISELKFVNTENQVTNSALIQEYNRINDIRKNKEQTNWLPATEVKGEGIFLTLKNDLINSWMASDPAIKERANKLKNNYLSNLKKFDPNIIETQYDHINEKYILLHTLSHVLIDKIAQSSGYNSASLSEIIYSSNPDSNFDMSGILIYTSGSDVEGTLGGLAEHGKPEKLASVFNAALDSASWCSSDPLCIETSEGQGFMGVNLSACHSCCMLPENSCENFNKFLDRGLLIGTLENKEIGFFNYIDQIDGKSS